MAEERFAAKKLELLAEALRFTNALIVPLSEVALASPAKAKKLQTALNRFEKKVIVPLEEELNVEVLSFAPNSLYEEGMPVEAINLEDFEGVDNLVIKTMLEPVIKVKGSSEVLRNGKVVLARGED